MIPLPKPTNKLGAQTFVFPNPPKVAAFAAIVGDMEGNGRYGGDFDIVLDDDLWHEDTWEKAESKMFESAVRTALSKENISHTDLDCLLGGDLLNQIISANFAARQLALPFLGLYGACSTMAESLLVGSVLISAGHASCVACATSSHFATAERQYRYPLELGTQRTPTAQRTVTGSGAMVLVCNESQTGTVVHITHATVGKVVDMGILDANNMGAAMAPAAADTIITHMNDLKRTPNDYDLIVTGDLGTFGSKLCVDLCKEKGMDITSQHFDCGAMIFWPEQNVDCGGSGCGCCASVLNGHLIKRLIAGELNRVLFMATGALMSPDSSQQGESIPCIAHAVVFERRA